MTSTDKPLDVAALSEELARWWQPRSMCAPTVPDLAKAWNEGREAAAKGLHFKDACPYTFDKFPGITVADFNLAKRGLMDEWFKAWKQHRDGSTRAG